MNLGISKQEYIKRYILFVIGLYILSFGIALSTKANLGVTPVSSIPYVLSLVSPLSMGKVTIIVQLFYILIEFLILRKDFKIIHVLQIFVVVLFGYFTDFSLFLVSNVNPQTYPTQWMVCILSMFIIAFGLNMEVRAGVVMLAVDGLMYNISQVFHIDFGKVKVGFDCSQVAVTVVISFICLHQLKGVREGTVAAAIIVGLIIKMYNKKLAKFYTRLGLVPIKKQTAADTADQSQGTSTTATGAPLRVITIAREVGCGGYDIGQILGHRLNIPVYNKDMLAQAADAQGLSPEAVEKKEQNMIYHFFTQLNNDAYAPLLGDQQDNSFTNVQQKLVEQVASKESCIIIGRLSSYFLRNNPNCFHVFLYGTRENRAAFLAKREGITVEKALAEIDRVDLQRARHHEFYAGTKYGDYTHHHISLDTFAYGGLEECADIIVDVADKYYDGLNK